MPRVAFIVSRDISPIGNNVDDREFYLSVDHELYTRLGIGNCTSFWSPYKFVRKLMLVYKSDTEAFFFFHAIRNPVRKRKVYKTKVVIQNSAIKCYHEFHVRSHKDLETLILEAPFLLLTKVIL